MTRPNSDVRVRRIYDQPRDDDGYRVLVDRLWPRGVSKERAALDTWLAEVAPSTELRTWWHHDEHQDPDRFGEFIVRYLAELDSNPAVEELRELIRAHPVVTLLYSVRDPDLNHAVVLRDYLAESNPASTYPPPVPDRIAFTD